MFSIPELMGMDVAEAEMKISDRKSVCDRLAVLRNLGLGYLTLGEATTSLSGGEAQRLKLAAEMGAVAGRFSVCIRRTYNRTSSA